MASLRDTFTFAAPGISQQGLEELQVQNMGTLRKTFEGGRIGHDANAAASELAGLRAAGRNEEADALQAQLEQLQQRQGLYAPEVGGVENIKGVGDLGTWALESVGQGAASMVDPIAATAAMNAGGRLLGMSKHPAAQLVSKALTWGAPAVAYGMNHDQLKGEFVQNAMRDPELMARTSWQDLNQTANVQAAGGAVLDTALPAVLGRQLVGKAGMSALGKLAPTSFGGRTLAAMGLEGATEVGQNVGSQIGLGYLNPNRDTSGDFMENVNAGLGGMVGSGPFSAAGAAAEGGYQRMGGVADALGKKAGDTVDLATGAVDSAKEKGKGLFGKLFGGNEAEDLQGSDGAAPTGFKLSPEERSTLNWAKDNEGRANEPGFDEEFQAQEAKRTEVTVAKLAELAESDDKAADILERAGNAANPTEQIRILSEGSDYLLAKHDLDDLDATGRNLPSKGGELVGRAAKGIAKGAVKVAGEVAKGVARGLSSKKNLQADEGGSTSYTLEDWESTQSGRRSASKQAAAPTGPEQSARANLAARQAAEWVRTNHQGKEGLARMASHTAFELIDAAKDFRRSDVAGVEPGARNARLNRIASVMQRLYGTQEATKMADTIASIVGQDGNKYLASAVEYVKAEVQRLDTPVGRVQAKQERQQRIDRLANLVPPQRENFLLDKGINIRGQDAEQFASMLENLADGTAPRDTRQELNRLFGAATVNNLLAELNQQAIATGKKETFKEAVTFANAPAEVSEQLDVNDDGEVSSDDRPSDYDKRMGSKKVERGASGVMVAFDKASTTMSKGSGVDVFSGTKDGDTGEVKRPWLFKKGQKLFNGGDAIKNRIANLRGELKGRADSYKVAARSAWDVMTEDGVQPGRLVAAYRDYLRQEATHDERRSKPQYTEAQRKAMRLEAMDAAKYVLDTMTPPKKGDAYRLPVGRRKEIAKATKKFFQERFVVTAESPSDRVSNRIDLDELNKMISATKKAVDRARMPDQDEAKIFNENNLISFTRRVKGEDKPAHIRADDLMKWGRNQRLAEEEFSEQTDFSNDNANDQYVADLMSAITAVMDSGFVRKKMPTKINMQGQIESFADGIPPSLRLATTTQGKRDAQREANAQKGAEQLRKLGPEAVGKLEAAKLKESREEAAREQMEGDDATSAELDRFAQRLLAAKSDRERSKIRQERSDFLRSMRPKNEAGELRTLDPQDYAALTPDERKVLNGFADRYAKAEGSAKADVIREQNEFLDDLSLRKDGARYSSTRKFTTVGRERGMTDDAERVNAENGTKLGVSGPKGGKTPAGETHRAMGDETKTSRDDVVPSQYAEQQTEDEAGRALPPDEFSDQRYRSRVEGFKPDANLPRPKSVMRAYTDANRDAAEIVKALTPRPEGKEVVQAPGALGRPAEGFAMIEARLRAAERPTSGEGLLGGMHFILPVLKVLNGDKLGTYDFSPEEAVKATELRARAATILLNAKVSEPLRVRMARELATEAGAKVINEKNVGTALRRITGSDKVRAAPEVAAQEAPKGQTKPSGGATLTVNDHKSSGYRDRTKFNADSADVTVAIAKDFSTAGERLTRTVAGSRYTHFGFGDARKDGRALAKLMQQRGATSLNVAGNGIYTLTKYGLTQAEVNQHVYEMLSEAHAINPITKIVSGGQTGVDIAGAVAAQALGIDAVITLPQGFLQRNEAREDRRLSRDEIVRQIEEGAAALKLRKLNAQSAGASTNIANRAASQGKKLASSDPGLRAAFTVAADDLRSAGKRARQAGMSREQFLVSPEFMDAMRPVIIHKLTGTAGAQAIVDDLSAMAHQLFAIKYDKDLEDAVASRLAATDPDTPAKLSDMMQEIIVADVDAVTKVIARAVKTAVGDTNIFEAGKKDIEGNDGVYNYSTQSIHIARDADLGLAGTVLHEGVHAATVAAVVRDKGLHRAVYRLMDHVAQQNPQLKGAYGLKDSLEFLAEGLSNASFQRELAKIKPNDAVARYLGKTVANAWDAFVGLVRSALNLDPKHESALAQLLDLGGRAMASKMDNPSAVTVEEFQEFFRRGVAPVQRARDVAEAMINSPRVRDIDRAGIRTELEASISNMEDDGLVPHKLIVAMAATLETFDALPAGMHVAAQSIFTALDTNLGSGDFLIPNSSGRKLNAQDAREPRDTPASPEEIAKAKAWMNKVLPKVRVEFEKITGYSGEFIEAENLVRISTTAAAGVMQTAYHEGLHAFFAGLAKNPEALRVLSSIADNRVIFNRLQALLHKYPAAQAQLVDGEERLAYTFQFWAADKLQLPVGPARGLFAKLRKFFRQVAGLIKDEEKAADIFQAFNDGKLGDPSTAGKVLNDILAQGTWTKKNLKRLDGLMQRVRQLIMPAEEILMRAPSAEAKALARQLFTNPGDEGSAGMQEGLLNAQRTITTKEMNRFANAIEGLDDKDMANVAKLMQDKTPLHEIPYAPYRKAVKEIRQQLEDFHGYLTTSGMEIGKGKESYFPRVWSLAKLIDDREGFVKMLMDNYPERLAEIAGAANLRNTKNGKLKDGAVEMDNKAAAEEIANYLIRRNGTDGKVATQREDGVLAPYFAAGERREFAWIETKHSEPWQNKNLIGIMTGYLHEGVRSAEYTRRFGRKGEHLDASLRTIEAELTEHARAELAKGEFKDQKAANAWVTRQMRGIRQATGAMEGSLGKDISDRMRKFNSWMMVYQNVRLLPLTLFASVVDPMGMIARGATMREAFEAFQRGIREVFRGWADLFRQDPKGALSDKWTKLAEHIGAVDAAILSHHASEEYSSTYLSPGAKRINDAFFKINGMEAWNRGMRVGAVKSAAAFIARHKALPEVHSQRWLTELGLTPDQIVLDENGELVTDVQLLMEQTGVSKAEAQRQIEAIHSALNRWTLSAVLTPNAAQRPAWSSDPHFSLFFHLKQFSYSFHQTILKRAVKEMNYGNMGPIATFAGYIPVMIASDVMKGLIVGGGELPAHMKGMDLGDWVMRGLERSGTLGIGAIGVDASHDMFSILGPSAEQLVDGITSPIAETTLRALPLNPILRAVAE
jgi:hypothetical protein